MSSRGINHTGRRKATVPRISSRRGGIRTGAENRAVGCADIHRARPGRQFAPVRRSGRVAEGSAAGGRTASERTAVEAVLTALVATCRLLAIQRTTVLG